MSLARPIRFNACQLASVGHPSGKHPQGWAEPQRIADTFLKLKLLTKAIQVQDAVFSDVLV